MASATSQLTNTFSSYDMVGDREDLSDLISDISPTDTPFLSNIGSRPASNTYFEWQTDALDAAAENHQLDGFNIDTFSAVTATARIGNWTSISEKDWIISGTEEAVTKAGRQSEKGYQAVKAAKALKRDIETNYLANNAGAAGSDPSTARETGGLAAFLKTNVNKSATNGVDPVWTSAPTDARSDGTARAFIESDLQNVILQCWTSGGEPTMVLMGGFNKQAASAFAGIAAQRYMAPEGVSTIIGAADLYVSDFGTLSFVPSRFQPAHYAYVIDPDRVRRRILRPYFSSDLAKTGDADKKMFVAEEGLQVDNEAAHGIVADLSTS